MEQQLIGSPSIFNQYVGIFIVLYLMIIAFRIYQQYGDLCLERECRKIDDKIDRSWNVARVAGLTFFLPKLQSSPTQSIASKQSLVLLVLI